MAIATISKALGLRQVELPIPKPVTLQDYALFFKQDMYKEFNGWGQEFEKLSPEELQILEEIAKYDGHSEILINAELRELVFKCCLRDKLPVQILLKWPHLAQKIQETTLSRLCLNFKGMIQVSEDGKDVTIPIAASLNDPSPRRYSLLRPYDPIETGNKMYTISKIFDHFLNRKQGKTTFEFDVINGAIRPWKGYIGLYESLGDKIDTSQTQWWNPLEPYQKLSQRETLALVKEGIKRQDEQDLVKLDPTKAVIRAVATTSTPKLTVLNNHALIEIFYPNKDGSYSLYPFGSFPRYFPKKFLEIFPFFLNGDKGDIRYPDPRNVIPGKVQSFYTFLVTKEVAQNVFNVIGQKIGLSNSPAWDGRFHVRHHSCSHWTLDVLNKGIQEPLPDIFYADQDQVDSDSHIKRAVLELFEQNVWSIPLLYWNQLGAEVPLPVELTRRQLTMQNISSFMDLTADQKRSKDE